MSNKLWIWVLVAKLALAIVAPAQCAPEITSLVYAPDGKTLVSAGLDDSLRFWDVPQGKERSRIQAHTNGVYAIAISPDGKLLASAGGDRLVRLWDLAKAREIRTFEGHLKEAVAVAFSPDGKFLGSGSYDKTIRIWETATGKELHVLRGHEHWITAVAFSPGGKTLASGGIVPFETDFFKGNTQGDKIRIWDYVAGKQLEQLPIKGSRVAFSADGKTLASAGMYIDLDPTGKGHLKIGNDCFDCGSRITLWDVTKGKERLRISQYWTGIAFSPDGKYLATYWGGRPHSGGMILGNENKSKGIHLWETASGKEILHFSTPHEKVGGKEDNPLLDLLALQQGPTALAISPDGTQLAAGNGNGKVQFWDLTPKEWRNAGGLGPDELAKSWADLTSENAPQAYQAVWTLAGAGEKAVAFLKDHLKQAPAAETRPPAEEARLSRAVIVLERIGTKGAQAVLQDLAKGPANASLTQDAKAALERLAKR